MRKITETETYMEDRNHNSRVRKVKLAAVVPAVCGRNDCGTSEFLTRSAKKW